MGSKKIISFIALVGLIIIVLYEINLPLEFAHVEALQISDPEVEAEFSRCYDEKDVEMHAAVFGAIDNPDVQKEMISTNRERIARECRQRFPEQLIMIERDVPSNLVELKPRFW